MFSFLNPWLWLGALAVAGPLYLHLRRKREHNLIRFSAVRFLQDQSRARRSPWSFRNLLLLLLRVSSVVLIAGAFAWPYWRSPRAFPVQESVVYILDNTLSRQAGNGFARDKDRIVSELQNARPDAQAAVIELTAGSRVVATFGEERQSAIRNVQELRPSFQHGSYLSAFRQANSILVRSAGQRRRIVLLGDNQANQWNENVSTPPFLRDVQVDLPKPPAQSLPNLWLCDPRAQRVFLGDKSQLNLSMRLGHLGPARVAKVTIRVNDRIILDRAVEVENQPQNILIQTQCEASAVEWLRVEGTVEGTPDSLSADNQVYCAVRPVAEGKVALLAQSAYLRLALSPEVMRGQWATEILKPEELGTRHLSSQDADVLCLESAYLESAEVRSLVSRFLAAGKGVLLFVNRLTPAIDGCLRELGFESDGPADAGPQESGKFQFVLSNHPIFQPFQSPDFGNLMDVTIARYARLRASAARPLIVSQAGNGLLFESTKYPGKLFVGAFGLERDQTSWPIHPTFIPFLDLTLQAARPQGTIPNSFHPAELALLPLPSNVGTGQLVLRQHGREVGRSKAEGGRAQVRLPASPGLYEMNLDGRQEILNILSVNAPATESELVFLDTPGDVAEWSMHGAGNPNALRRAQPGTVGFSAILQQRFWWWMIFSGLIALTLETLLVAAKGEKDFGSYSR